MTKAQIIGVVLLLLIGAAAAYYFGSQDQAEQPVGQSESPESASPPKTETGKSAMEAAAKAAEAAENAAAAAEREAAEALKKAKQEAAAEAEAAERAAAQAAAELERQAAAAKQAAADAARDAAKAAQEAADAAMKAAREAADAAKRTLQTGPEPKPATDPAGGDGGQTESAAPAGAAKPKAALPSEAEDKLADVAPQTPKGPREPKPMHDPAGGDSGQADAAAPTGKAKPEAALPTETEDKLAAAAPKPPRGAPEPKPATDPAGAEGGRADAEALTGEAKSKAPLPTGAEEKRADAAPRPLQTAPEPKPETDPAAGEGGRADAVGPAEKAMPKAPLPTESQEKLAAAVAPRAPHSPRAMRESDTLDEPDASGAPKAAPTVDPKLAALPPAMARPDGEAAETAKPGARAAPTPARPTEPDVATQEQPPQFDVAEVDKHGDMVVAGTAAPGAVVRLVTEKGEVLGEALAGDDGSFTLLPDRPLPEGDSALSLETAKGGAVAKGAETIVVSRRAGAAPLVVLQTDDATTPSRVLQQPEAPEAIAAANDNAPDANASDDNNGPAAIATEGVRTRDRDLTVGSVDYDAKGRLAVTGKAPPGAEIVVDADGKPVATVTADAKGDWTATTEAGAAGAAGRIGATAQTDGMGPLRVSLPFAPAGLIRQFPQGRMVVVQPGNSLWRIARRTYGHGVRYTVIYAANRRQIANPDMIFPGQILHAPKPREG